MNVMAGIIDHRILLNYRIDPDCLRALLPAPLRPKLVNGRGIGGICQVSLSKMRPRGAPALIGTRSNNAAHRIAVLYGEDEGVFIPRRDTDSRLNQFAGGRVFPGQYQRSRFQVNIQDDQYAVAVTDRKGRKVMSIDATVSQSVSDGSVFSSTSEGSAFFQAGNMGWSPGKEAFTLDAIELWTHEWRMEPLAVHSEFSSYFSNHDLFPPGTVEFDSGFIMRGLEHEWRAHDGVECVCA